MKKTWVIYMHRNKINGKVYIGQTCQDVKKRWKNGKGYFKKTNTHFGNAIKKYGWDNFEHIILVDGIESLEVANALERYWIKQFNSVCNGYNVSSGGSLGSPWDGKTEEEKDIYKNKISATLSGSNHPNYGKELKQETKNKISIKVTGEKNGMYGKKGEQNPWYGNCHMDETKKILSEKKKGEKNPWYNKHLTEEHKEKIKKGQNCKSIIGINENSGVIVFFDTIQDSKKMNFSPTHVVACCKGKNKTHKGYDWYYFDDFEYIFLEE